MRVSLDDSVALCEQLDMLQHDLLSADAVQQLETCVARLEMAEAGMIELAASMLKHGRGSVAVTT